jgi:hypothetical protein
MGNGDIETHAVIQISVRDVPMIIPEIPRLILAKPQHEDRPGKNRHSEEQNLAWHKKAGTGRVG